MNAIPLTLADGVSKRNLVKNIRELYSAKGTSEGHKIFMRMLLGEKAEITYPNQWSFFGGGIEEDETPWMALKREIKEELEQLRALDHNIKINVALAKSSPIGVDTKEDYLAIKKIMEYKT